MDSIRTPCEVCHGKRFQDSVLQYKLDGKSISDVLELTVSEALEFFTDKKILKKITAMEEVGIGYVTLGQALSTLSGGECQRLKLANELHKKDPFTLWMNQQLGFICQTLNTFCLLFTLL